MSPIIVPISEADLPSLLARIEARDQQAFDQLYRHYSPMVQSYLRTKTRDPNLIEDVVSRTLFEVWQYPTRYQPDRGAKFSTWLIQIAIHKLQDAWRAAPPQSEELPEDLGDAFTTERDGYVATLQDQMKRVVHRCVDRLRPRLKEFVMLVTFGGLSEQEVAATLGCERGTVKSSMSHARTALKVPQSPSKSLKVFIEKLAGPGGIHV